MPLTDIPKTRVRHSQGLSINVSNTPIGAVHRFDDRLSKNLEMVFSFGPLVAGGFSSSSASPFDIVPGNITSQEIQMERWDLFTAVWEQVLSFLGNITSLQQIRSASLRASTLQPAGEGAGNISSTADVETFEGCWLQDYGRPMSADQDRKVNVSGTWMYTFRLTQQGVSVGI